ncbi:hypothetical protein GGD83_003017 [Rhodoblastus sphagnicola]|uniref:primase-helicase family protein n=1 Tax=Rhodoblastus sphagnicola TaxID=333368 RepID=UPI0011B0AB3B|nr:DUF5906 domain-containing protein [Rhodoblastus sphagnicola]MBB4199203.1 hypothetical protein [Rhodoblastus sphagnicola]
MRRRLAGEVVATGQKDGKPTYTDAFTFWTGHAARHVYRRVAFTSKPVTDDTLNLFRGLGVKPRPGKCERIINHVQEVICSGDVNAGDAMLKLLAWQIQNIGKPSRVVVVLKSKKQQAGKGILLGELMAKIYGPSGFTAAATDQILGRFNSAIRGRAFIFLDEVLFAGDRKSADGIKSLSTATVIGIEEKGLPIVQCPIAVNLWLASNHENAAHIEEDDARYWALDVSPHRVGDTAYFSELTQEIENGGREAFAHHLLNMDVSDFVPARDVPKDNETKANMVRASVNPFDARKWLEDCCNANRVIGAKNPDAGEWTEWVEGERHSFGALMAAYSEWQKTVKSPVAPLPTPSGNLGEVLGKAGLTEAPRTKFGRGRILPNADTCKANIWRRDDN